MQGSFISWCLSGAVGFVSGKGAEVMWPNASSWEWWGFGLFLFCLLMLYSHWHWLTSRLYAALGEIVSGELKKAVAPALDDEKQTNENAGIQTEQIKKKKEAIREINILISTLEYIGQRGSRHSHFPNTPVFEDHQLWVLRDKYQSWIPTDIDETGLSPWLAHILAILSFYNYSKADELIRQAIVDRTWEKWSAD